jgi:hypothetical protein
MKKYKLVMADGDGDHLTVEYDIGSDPNHISFWITDADGLNSIPVYVGLQGAKSLMGFLSVAKDSLLTAKMEMETEND